MKKLLDAAAKVSDEAEVFFIRDDSSSLDMRNGVPTEMSASIQSGYALRILKGGRIGTAYTKNLLDRDELVSNALNSLKGEVKAGFTFPGPEDIPSSDETDTAIAEMGFHDLEAYSGRVLDHLKNRIEGQIDVSSARGVQEMAIMNSKGIDLSRSRSEMYIFTSLLFPKTESGVRKLFHSGKAGDFPHKDLDDLVELYSSGLPKVDIPSGRMKVVFTPDTLYTLLWRLTAASSGASFHKRVSPLLEKRGERIVSEKFTLYGDPTDPDDLNRRYFDDEGVPTGKHTIIEDGVFRNLILNLNYAHKLDEKPTGNGYRGGMWGGETVALAPSPTLYCSRIAPGDVSFSRMIAGIDRGVIVLGVLGAHSGNILNGDFSIGLDPGFYVENGRIKGRVNDGMVAGNVYDVLQNVEAVENTLHESITGGKLPSILLSGVSVAAK